MTAAETWAAQAVITKRLDALAADRLDQLAAERARPGGGGSRGTEADNAGSSSSMSNS